jgi:hypothetical protein
LNQDLEETSEERVKKINEILLDLSRDGDLDKK